MGCGKGLGCLKLIKFNVFTLTPTLSLRERGLLKVGWIAECPAAVGGFPLSRE